MAQLETGAETIRWNLSDLYASLDDPKIQTTLEQADKDALQFEQTYKNQVHQLASSDLVRAFQNLEKLIGGLYLLGQYASLLFSIDTADEKLKAFEAKVNELSARVENKLVFFDLELGHLSKEQIDSHCTVAELKPYHYYLQRKYDTAQHDLSEKEEQLANLKNLTGSQAFYTLYEELVSSFRFEFKVDGQLKLMNGDELRSLRQHPDPEVRREAMSLFFKSYQDNRIVITNCFNNIIKSYNIEREMRNYPSAISKRNVGNDLSDEAVAALHEATTASNVMVQKYYRLKSDMMDMPDMTLADIYAPLPQSTRTYTWQEAKNLVLTAFKEFDEEFYLLAKAMFDENRIDAPVLPSKRGGAFCSSSLPAIKPFVMLNFTGRLRDVSTLAHELGHAIHAMLCKDQSLFNCHAILPLAETASIFSEMILTDYFLKHETDKKLKKSLITTKLEEIFASSHRQNMFSCFELKTHESIHKQLMSADELCQAYRQELEKMFGDAVALPEEYNWEWSAIPHMFAYPFYVYSYNFANLLVLALYQQYLEEGKDFVPKFKKLLSSGSAMSPTKITGQVEADINNPEFWKKSLVLIDRLIGDLKELL